jgi:Nicotianamine synthase protein
MLTAALQRRAQAYIDLVSDVYTFLIEQSDLSPCNQMLNATLYRFVRDTIRMRSPEEVAIILNNQQIRQIAPRLRQLLAHAEYEMEHFCALAMVSGKTDVEEGFSSYRNFIYRDNYDALVAAELDAVERHTHGWPTGAGCGSVAFVGAGPLPISAIMFHQRTGLQVTCIDSDSNACRLGRELVLYLAANETDHKDIDKAIHFVNAFGEEHDYGMHPIVLIASLVEMKTRVIMRIANTAHAATTTIIRSAEGLSTLLYNSEDCIAGQEKYNAYLAGKTRPSPEAINTSLVYRFPSAAGGGSAGMPTPRISSVAGSFTLNVSGSITTP